MPPIKRKKSHRNIDSNEGHPIEEDQANIKKNFSLTIPTAFSEPSTYPANDDTVIAYFDYLEKIWGYKLDSMKVISYYQKMLERYPDRFRSKKFLLFASIYLQMARRNDKAVDITKDLVKIGKTPKQFYAIVDLFPPSMQYTAEYTQTPEIPLFINQTLNIITKHCIISEAMKVLIQQTLIKYYAYIGATPVEAAARVLTLMVNYTFPKFPYTTIVMARLFGVDEQKTYNFYRMFLKKFSGDFPLQIPTNETENFLQIKQDSLRTVITHLYENQYAHLVDHISSLVERYPGLPTPMLEELLVVPPDQIDKILNSMLEQQLLVTRKEGRNNVWFIPADAALPLPVQDELIALHKLNLAHRMDRDQEDLLMVVRENPGIRQDLMERFSVHPPRVIEARFNYMIDLKKIKRYVNEKIVRYYLAETFVDEESLTELAAKEKQQTSTTAEKSALTSPPKPKGRLDHLTFEDDW